MAYKPAMQIPPDTHPAIAGNFEQVAKGFQEVSKSIDSVKKNSSKNVRIFSQEGTTVDPSTNSTTYSDLEEMKLSFATEKTGSMVMFFSSSFQTQGGGTFATLSVRFAINGVGIAITERSVFLDTGSVVGYVSLLYSNTFGPGVHEVKVEWKSSSAQPIEGIDDKRALCVLLVED